ncbi:MAG: DUF3552 domain-containing protein [Deltaproteobacteria bacterium]|nr:DUF3552 domain-containing protein [Deltaproteobacteria bacterium]
MLALLLLVTFSAGLALGLVVARRGALRQVAAARSDARANLERATERAARIKADAALRAAERGRELERQALEELQAEEQDLQGYDTELAEREQLAAGRETELAAVEAEVLTREKAASAVREEAVFCDAEREDLDAKILAKLESLGGAPRAEVIQHLVLDAREKAALQAQILIRDREAQANKEAVKEGTRVMGIIVDRYDGIGHLERIQNIIEIADPKTLAALAEAEGEAHTIFRQETGCELVCDVAAATVTVRGDDPLAREVARRALRQLVNRAAATPDKIRGIAAQVKEEVDREVQNAGRKAARQLGLQEVHPEILHLVGRLKFRLSYSQNQLKHAIEVAYLAGMLAEELGIDVGLARRGGLLHDIGKAMTHDHEGSHALLGAEVARRCGEVEAVANAIGSHHNDEPMHGPVSYVVTAADALSGARPGARRESVTSYISRIEEIQDIAGRSAAVRRVDVMHAGREVRVIVAGEEQGAVDDADRQGGVVLTDSQLQPLAAEIARALEAEITYAGQIRVTVIRESRAVAIAS